MTARVTLTSQRAGRSVIAGPFDTADNARAWAAGWTPAVPASVPAGDLAAAQRDGAIPPDDWAATVTEEVAS